MNKIVDDNFLGGTLNICSMPEHNLVIGRLVVYDRAADDFIEFTAKAKCNSNDTFNENTGIRLVKLRISKQYHSYNKKYAKMAVKCFERSLNAAKADYNRSTKKINNIEHSIKKMYS